MSIYYQNKRDTFAEMDIDQLKINLAFPRRMPINVLRLNVSSIFAKLSKVFFVLVKID